MLLSTRFIDQWSLTIDEEESGQCKDDILINLKPKIGFHPWEKLPWTEKISFESGQMPKVITWEQSRKLNNVLTKVTKDNVQIPPQHQLMQRENPTELT